MNQLTDAQQRPGQKIIIDTDPGDDVDDVLAVAFALLRPELDVRAITSVTGDTRKRAQIIAKLLALLGRDDVEVAAGMPLPLRPLDAAGKRHWMEPRGYRLNQYPWVSGGTIGATAGGEGALPELPAIQDDAVAVMARVIGEHAGQIALVAIGPLTNIAVLLRRYPAVTDQLQWIAIMGGEVELDRAENNIVTDPVAADIVFTSGVPLFLGTWSVTRGFVLSPADCAQIKAAATPLTEGLSACIDLWWPHKGQKPGPVMYDLAPILWSYDRSFYPTEAKHVRVEMRDQARLGRTTLSEGDEAPNAAVSVGIAAEAVRALYLQTILRGF